jgi:hypothetical protein
MLCEGCAGRGERGVFGGVGLQIIPTKTGPFFPQSIDQLLSFIGLFCLVFLCRSALRLKNLEKYRQNYVAWNLIFKVLA